MPYGHPTKHTLLLPDGNNDITSHVFDTKEESDLFTIAFGKQIGKRVITVTIDDNEKLSIYHLVSLLMHVGYDKFFVIYIPPQTK